MPKILVEIGCLLHVKRNIRSSRIAWVETTQFRRNKEGTSRPFGLSLHWSASLQNPYALSMLSLRALNYLPVAGSDLPYLRDEATVKLRSRESGRGTP